MVMYVCYAFLFHVFVSCSAVYRENLNGNWTLWNDKRGFSLQATVPGSVYTALLSAKMIEDPLYRDNDVKYKWIGREDWIYSRTFNLTAAQVNMKSILLVCDGLDTVSKITVNDEPVGTSDNMFVKYTYDIKRFARTGLNSITIFFRSAVTVAQERADNSSYVIPPECPQAAQHGECHVNMIRKEQCSFSWDWGPSFPTQGIWKDIYVLGFNSAVIKDISATVHKAGQTWSVNVTAYFDVISQGQVLGNLLVQLMGTSVSKSQQITLTKGVMVFSFVLQIPSNIVINEWWPNGYGKQTLYSLAVSFTSSRGDEESHQTIRIGFRTIELVQQPVSSKDPNKGLTFYFKINGVPMFFKGSNWIPADSFQETITKERLRRLLTSAAEVHINSMRVWGGGVFESEDFYDLTDELGIMIWQDLMFSDALYPVGESFLESVKQEVTYQVRRLKHRPSVAVWAGNNENEGILRSYSSKPNYTRYYDDYIKLYIDTVRPIVLSEDCTREFLSSSPSDGVETQRQGWVAKDPGDELYGDTHYYNYLGNLYNDSTFPIPRFTSEFGVQAWCDAETLEDVFLESDFDYWGDMAAHRQHHPFGQMEMLSEVIQHMQQPDTPDTKQKFKDLIYLTQINQAESIRTEAEHYRRWQTDLMPDGRGLTMGALYWQLNDIWQAPSWASIDYEGKWKMLHYYARKFFSPTLISPYIASGNLSVSVVVDEVPVLEVRDSATGNLRFQPDSSFVQMLHSEFLRSEAVHLMSKVDSVTTGQLVIQMYSWDSFTALKTWEIPFKLYRSAEVVFTKSMADMMKEAGCIREQKCFFYLYKEHDSQSPTWLPMSYMKDVQGLAKAHISITTVTQTSPTEFEIILSSNRIAPYVWLDAYKVKGRFSDNGFLMMKARTSVKYTSWEPVELIKFTQSLSVKSLLDVYNHFS
ncbi:beta-mannosidase-like [Gigantopelta aegis]|uniref:beta-mannosidase-like n=1 Tax=Gigantopelta aegis TaxID=1735272 RepID=UPI001B888037|nr:beta-mannosidase-like [Gigantopelta aegis]